MNATERKTTPADGVLENFGHNVEEDEEMALNDVLDHEIVTENTSKPSSLLSSSDMITTPLVEGGNRQIDLARKNKGEDDHQDSKPPPVVDTSLSASEAFYSSGDDAGDVLYGSDLTLGKRQHGNSDEDEIKPLQHHSSSSRHSKTPFGLVSSIVSLGMYQHADSVTALSSKQTLDDNNSVEMTCDETESYLVEGEELDQELESSQDHQPHCIKNNDQPPPEEDIPDEPVEADTSPSDSQDEAIRELKLRQKTMLFEDKDQGDAMREIKLRQKAMLFEQKEKKDDKESDGELRNLDSYYLAKQMVAETKAAKEHLGAEQRGGQASGRARVSFNLDDDGNGANQTVPLSSSSSSSTQRPGAFRVGRIGRREWSDRRDGYGRSSSNNNASNRSEGGSTPTAQQQPQHDFMVEATLVSPNLPPDLLEEESQDFSRRNSATNDLVYAEKLKKSWFTDKRVQCAIVTVLFLAIGITLWAVLTAPRARDQELAVMSNSPSISLVPSPAPSTSRPSISPSQAPTGVQTGVVTLVIEFDDYPQEVSWVLSGPCGVVQEVETGEYKRQVYRMSREVVQIELPVGVTYTFTFADSYDDGFCCPRGSAILSTDDTVFLKVTGDYGTSETAQVTLPGELASAFTCAPTAAPTKSISGRPSYSPAPSLTPRPSSAPTATRELFHSFEVEGLCIEIPNFEIRNGVSLMLADCTYGLNQLWNLVDGHIISAVDKSMCIDSEDVDVSSRMQLFECVDGYAPQNFTLNQSPHPNVLLNDRSGVKICAYANRTSLEIVMDECNDNRPTSWDRRYGGQPANGGPTAAPSTFLEGSVVFEANGLCATVGAFLFDPFDPVEARPCATTRDFLWSVDRNGFVRSVTNRNFCWSTGEGEFPLVLDYCYPSGDRFLFDDNGRIRLAVNDTLCLTPLSFQVSETEFETDFRPILCDDESPIQVFRQIPWSELPVPPTAAPSVSQAPTTFGTLVLELAIFFDFQPTEFGWILAGPCGVVAEATPGHYDNYVRRTQVVEFLEVQAGHNYNLTLLDLGGNGLCCPSGRVTLSLSNPDGTRDYFLRIADDFGASLSTDFTVAGTPTTIDCAAFNL